MDAISRFGRARFTRRSVVAGAATVAGLAALPGSALAQSALQDVLMAPNRGGWNDQFDTRSANVASVRSNQPVFSPNTAAAMQQAIAAYNQISMAGGWPMVPEGQVLKLGVEHPAVMALRERLAISGDLPRSAGQSASFDTYVDAAVKRFQTRHGLPSDGVVSEHTFKAMNVPTLSLIHI